MINYGISKNEVGVIAIVLEVAEVESLMEQMSTNNIEKRGSVKDKVFDPVGTLALDQVYTYNSLVEVATVFDGICYLKDFLFAITIEVG